jgi:spore maturation protein CgeB
VKIYLFYHSVISDWNNGNAHFLRGIVSSLVSLGHKVQIMEPKDGWSLRNLLMEKGSSAFNDFRKAFPFHMPVLYHEKRFDPQDYLSDADVVIVHEWNNPDIVRKIGEYKKINRRMVLLFHDTHHRSVTRPEEMGRYYLKNYDGVLAFGEVIKNIYIQRGWASNAWTWHEAADERIFHPVHSDEKDGDLVWIGNWGDDERTEELFEFIINPVRELGLRACFYGVRYPIKAIRTLRRFGIDYKGWLPNYMVPEVFSRFRVTVHVPRKPYVTSLPGIPTIRPFEALACGIPLICSPWQDKENLFIPGEDFLIARNGEEMKRQLLQIIRDKDFAGELSEHGLRTIRRRHLCDHRAEELMQIVNEIKMMERVSFRTVKVPS